MTAADDALGTKVVDFLVSQEVMGVNADIVLGIVDDRRRAVAHMRPRCGLNLHLPWLCLSSSKSILLLVTKLLTNNTLVVRRFVGQ